MALEVISSAHKRSACAVLRAVHDPDAKLGEEFTWVKESFIQHSTFFAIR